MSGLPNPTMQRNRDPIKKKSSIKSLFAVFIRSKSSLDVSEYPSKSSRHGSDKNSLSTASLPARPATIVSLRKKPSKQLGEEEPSLSTVSLPAQIRPPFVSHSPSSSSSSASSIDFASDASTITTPSTSSPSVLMKCTSFQSSNSTPDTSLARERSKRVLEGHEKQPSPLSTVTDAQSPYKFPTPPQSPVVHERPNSFQPKRRNSLSRLLLRRSQSNPDLTKTATEAPPVPPVPQIPVSAPSSRPTSSSSNTPSRKKTMRRRTSDISRTAADLEKPTSYTKEEKIEHRSILGADPMGMGFYLYPKNQSVPNPPRRMSTMGQGLIPRRGPPNWQGDDWNRNTWAGPNNGDSGYRTSGYNRVWRESRGRSFRQSVTSQIIVEESGEYPQGDTRRYSEIPVQAGHWQQPRSFPEPVPPIPANFARRPSLPSIESRLAETPPSPERTEKQARRASLHNSFDYLDTQMKIHENQIPHLDVPPQQRQCGDEAIPEDMALRQLQQGAVRFIARSDSEQMQQPLNPSEDRLNEFDFGFSKKLQSFGPIPIIRVEMVDV